MICDISPGLKQTLEQFRFQKSKCSGAIIMKVQRDEQQLVIESELQGCDMDEIRDTLPQQQPRFVLLSYMMKHLDSRISYPLCLVFYSPSGCSPEMQMLYAGSKNNLVKACGLTKNLEIRDLDELTDEFLQQKLHIS